MSYGYHPKITNQNEILPQMASASLQPPFYFGGSQVPVNLILPHGSGFRTQYKSATTAMKNLGVSGRGLENTYNRHSKICLPKHMSTIRKII